MGKGPDKKDSVHAGFTVTAVAAMLAITAFAACLTGAAWAWFSSSFTSGENELIGSNFVLSVDGPALTDDGWYEFNGEEAAAVTLTNQGTGTGYCLITKGWYPPHNFHKTAKTQ